MTTRILLIDDLRNFRDNRKAAVARTSKQALEVLGRNLEFDEIWLDHDLGLLETGIPDTIMPIVDFLSERAFLGDPYPVGTIYVHTSNPVGGRQMVTSLQRYGYDAVQVSAPLYFTV